MKDERLTVAETARVTGLSTLTVRIGLQRGVFEFGQAIQVSKNRYTYVVYVNNLAKYLGISREEVLQKI